MVAPQMRARQKETTKGIPMDASPTPYSRHTGRPYLIEGGEGGRERERDVTHNNSPNRVHPVIKIICKKCSKEANDIGDNIKKVILGIGFNNFISERAAVNHQ